MNIVNSTRLFTEGPKTGLLYKNSVFKEFLVFYVWRVRSYGSLILYHGVFGAGFLAPFHSTSFRPYFPAIILSTD